MRTSEERPLVMIPFPALNLVGLHATLSETVMHVRANEGLNEYLRFDDVRRDFEELKHSPNKRKALKEGIRELCSYDPGHKGEVLIMPMSNVPPGKTASRGVQITDRIEIDLDWVSQRLIPYVILSPAAQWRQAILKYGKPTGCTRFLIIDPNIERTIVIAELNPGNDLMPFKLEVTVEGVPKELKQLAPYVLILKWFFNVTEQLADMKALYPQPPSEETAQFSRNLERAMESLISKLKVKGEMPAIS